MRDVQADGRLLHMWRDMPSDMYSLMQHVIGATTLVTWLRRTVARYRHGQDATHGRQSTRSDASSDDLSPRVAPDEKPPLASRSSHHGEKVGPSATSSRQPIASRSTHDHEQAGPSTVEAAPLTKQALTSTAIFDVVPPVDP